MKPARTFALTIALALAFMPAAAESIQFHAIVQKVTDGDTVAVRLTGLPHPYAAIFGTISIRVAGIDTPESRKPPAKCVTEVKRGKQATEFMRAIVKPGDKITVEYIERDKYFRLVGNVKLPDELDWAMAMIEAGHAEPYFGVGKKQNWCRRIQKRD